MIGLTVTVILARLLYPEDYGVIASAQILVGLLAIFSTLGVYEVTVQKESLSASESSTLFFVSIFGGIIFFAIACACAPLFANLFSESKLLVVIPILSISLLLTAIGQVPLAILARNQAFSKMISLDLLGQAIAASTAVAIALGGGEYWSLVALNLIMAAIPALGAWVVTRWSPSRIRSNQFRQLNASRRFGSSVALGNGLNFVSGQIDKFIIGRYIGLDDLGLYTRAQQLGTYSNNLFFVAPHRFVVSKLARVQSAPGDYVAVLVRFLSVATWCAVLFGAIVAVSAKGVILILLGARWTDATLLLVLISIGNAAFVLAYSYQWVHMSLGNAKELLNANISRLLLFGILIVIGAQGGIVGIGIAYAVAVWILALFSSHSCSKHTHESLWTFLKLLFVPSSIAVVCCYVSLLAIPFEAVHIFDVLIRSAIVLVGYLILSTFLARSTLIRALEFAKSAVLPFRSILPSR